MTSSAAQPTPRAFINQDNYSDCLVAFLDVLGFRALVEAADANPEKRTVIREVQSVLRDTLGAQPQTKTHITQFSDSIVISAARTPVGAAWLAHCVNLLFFNLLNEGFLLRGGIAHGNLSHNQFGLFGPGLHKAYRADQPGSPPRVVLSPEVLEDYQAVAAQAPSRIDPYDGETMLHVLGLYEAYDAVPRAGGMVLDESARWIAGVIGARAEDMANPADVRAKWRWMREYWNTSVGVRGILASA